MIRQQNSRVLLTFGPTSSCYRFEQKTRITHVDDGFDFLGMNVRKYGGKLLIKLARENVRAFLRKVRELVNDSKALRHDALMRLLKRVASALAILNREGPDASCRGKARRIGVVADEEGT
jgi:hypothetical protein